MRIRLALLGVLFTLNEVIKMEKMARKKNAQSGEIIQISFVALH